MGRGGVGDLAFGGGVEEGLVLVAIAVGRLDLNLSLRRLLLL